MSLGSGAIGQFTIGQGKSPDAGTLSVTDLTTGSPVLATPAIISALGIDPACVLLLHGDGSNASTTIIDSSPLAHTMTAHGNAQLTTSSKKFGTAGMTFDGTGDYIDTPDSADYALASKDWTIDGWFKRTGGDGTRRMLWGQGDAANTADLLSTRLELLNSTNSLSVVVARGTSPFQVRVTGATAITDSNWHHAAVVRFASQILVFLDGTLDGSGTFDDPINDSPGAFAVGRAGDWDTNYWVGDLDEVRVSVGAARWTANFTPPAQAYGYDLVALALTPSSPALDSPAATVFYPLTASDLTTGSPALDSPTASVFYPLTASDLTTGSPVLDSPAAAVFYALTAVDLTTGSPALDSPAATVFNPLTASDLTTASPDLASPALSVGSQLTIDDLTTGSPVLDSPAATVFYALVASDLTTGSPDLGSPALSYGLLAVDLATGSPDLGVPVMVHPLGLTTGSPDLGTPVFFDYFAVDLAPGSPEFGTPTLSHHYALFVLDFETGSPDLDSPIMFVSLLAVDLATGSPELDAPVCTDQVLPRAEYLINVGDLLLDPIYNSMISNPARVYPTTPGLPAIDVLCINHTQGITVQFGIGVQTIRPAVDIRVREIEPYGVVREDLTNGQVVLWPDTPEEQVWNIETVLPRPGIWGEPSGELRLFLMDRLS